MTAGSGFTGGGLFHATWFRQLSAPAKACWHYIAWRLQSANFPGIAFLDLSALAEEMGEPEETVRAYISEFIGVGAVSYDPHVRVFWAHAMCATPRSLTTVKMWGGLLLSIPACPVKKAAVRRIYDALLTISATYAAAFEAAASLAGDAHRTMPKRDRKKKTTSLADVAPMQSAAPTLTLVPPPIETPAKPKRARAPRPAGRYITFATWVKECRGRNEELIRDDDRILGWAEVMGLEPVAIQLAWRVFANRFKNNTEKTYVDWREAFRIYCEENYLKLWMPDPALLEQGVRRFVLTQNGRDKMVQYKLLEEAENATA